MPETHHHRPTLTQQNKPFKSKHASKSSLKDTAKDLRDHPTNSQSLGRTIRQSPKVFPTSNAALQSRLNRRNNAKQAQSRKREALISSTRIFNGIDGAPRIVAVIPLTEDVKARDTVCALAESLDVPTDDCPEDGLWKLKAERFKTSLQFIHVPYRNIYAALDACKAADYVIFILSPIVEVDTWGDTLLRTLQAQGLPDVLTVIPASTALDPKARPGIMKSLLSFVQYFIPSQTRVFDLHVSSDRLNALRSLAEGKPGGVRWREGRAWVLGESIEWDDENLKVTGVVRGASLSANRLVHLPNYGDFQISKIMSSPLPRPIKSGNKVNMDVEPTVLAEPSSSADSLVSSNDPDDLANEQTWPTEEEMQDTADASQELPKSKKNGKRIPKGMSEYQASWILDEDEDEDEDDRAEDHEVEMQEDEDEEMVEMHVDDDHEMEMDGRRSVAFHDLDNEEEAKQLETWRNRKSEEETETTFPDEIDTPKEVPARTRFQRYRGMRSFRTSPWDPFENLPRDYGRIFQFEDFKRTERGVRRRADLEIGTVDPGVRVTVYLRGVPKEFTGSGSIVLFGLLEHEHKVSVLNFAVQRNTEYDGSVRSKDPLILCVGPRRLRINPIYSQHTRGGGKGSNNVHKFERFFRHGVTNIATTYGPVVFGHQPCVLLRETSDPQAPLLVAMGTFLNPDTTRVIAKRIILTGHPFKVHKKTATVRYMFFNPEDVHYFKPIQLHTKHGRIGHIRESLGTHGYLKAHFDGPINQMDTVCMSLYKRVFPKWGELWKEAGAKRSFSDAMEE